VTTLPPLQVFDLGRRAYQPVLEYQRALVRARLDGQVTEDILLLVEHPPVVTLGRGTQETSLPIARDALRTRGFEVVEVERGGDVTVHAPGQLVGYPILDLSTHRKDLHWYLRSLEAALIEGLRRLEIRANRREGLTGVWVEDRKIASLGVHVKQWVTMHGFALNLSTDLSVFDVVVPCGIANVTMTSIKRERERQSGGVQLGSDVIPTVIQAFADTFHRTPVMVSGEDLTVPLGGNPG